MNPLTGQVAERIALVLKAGFAGFFHRMDDFLEFGELMCTDALTRDESCGGHFREEYQTPDGEAQRNDNDFLYVASRNSKEILRYGGIEKLADDDLNKLFVRLSRAFAAGGEESVSIREVKTAVAKVLDALIAKLNSNKLQANEDIAVDVIRDCVSMGSELPTNSQLEGMS